jgi:hypothetical protein
MSGSLSDLPTYLKIDAFRPHAFAIPPEQVVLESYTFLPYVRTGIAASLSRPFAWDLPKRTKAKLSVPVIADAGTRSADVDIVVRGPGDVTAFDPRQVIRCYPQPGTPNALTEEVAHVEFDRPDFPWLFTPAGPTPDGKLVPWVTLVVVPRVPGEAEPLGPGRPGELQVLTTTRAELPPLSDAWAWAHAQVMGGKNVPPEPEIAARLSPANPAINLSRLLSPRRLDPNTSYVACVVPTFRAGREVGLGQPPSTTTLAPSWNDGDDPATEVVLPVYYSFTFSTGEPYDFKALAERIFPVPAPAGVGRRRLDTTHPGLGIPVVGEGAAGREMVVEGPVVSLKAATEAEGWPSEAEQHWPAAQHDELRSRLNAVEAQKLAKNPDQHPTVGPPLYAGAHVRRTSVRDDSPGWFRELNDDPRNRVVAGVGVRVVQHDQEALMAEAWNQVGDVEAANAALRFAQLGRYVGASLHERHLKSLAPATLLALTHAVHSRILEAPDRTVRARVAVSSLPVGVSSAAFRRLVRPRGPVARFAAADLAKRAGAIGKLTADGGALTRSYVRPYRNPDGIDGLSPLARSLIPKELVVRAWPATTDPAGELTNRARALAKPSVTDALVGPELQELQQAEPTASLGPQAAATVALEQLLLALPEPSLIRHDLNAAKVARTLLDQLSILGHSLIPGPWRLPAEVVERVGLQGRADEDPRRTIVSADNLLEFTGRLKDVLTEVSSRHEELVEFSDIPTAHRLGELLVRLGNAEPGSLIVDLTHLGGALVSPGGLVDIDRDRIHVPDLGLLTKLDPKVTVKRRVLGRLTSHPGWLRPDWFDDARIEPVMAAPRFDHPMYEALDRYDRSWLIPGIGLIEESDMATLLETNTRFVEAFLVGLNHEFARELLWREYPTDGRATSFRSFWTRQVELVEDVHAFSDAKPLGGHLDQNLAGRVVLLVRGELIRRYPGLIAHAVLQADFQGGRPIFSGNPARTLFQINLAPNLLLVGFDVKADDVIAADPQPEVPLDPARHPWWFTLAENPTEPRFGLDDGPHDPGHLRDDLTWDDLLPAGQRFLRPAPPMAIHDGPPPPPPSPAAVTWGGDAAAVAHILYQPPSRAAFRAAAMVKKAQA